MLKITSLISAAQWLRIKKHVIKILKEIQQQFIETVETKTEITALSARNPSGDKSSQLDQLMEEKIISNLAQDYSGWIISEERNIQFIGDKSSNTSLFFVIDPLDGSRNVARGVPFASISIAIGQLKMENQQSLDDFSNNLTLDDIHVGIVMNLYTGSYYSAIKGKGAYKDKEKLVVQPNTKNQTVLLSMYGKQAHPSYHTLLQKLLISTNIRILGSIALELCLIAEGVLDALLDVRGKSRSVDFSAGMLIVEEAGGYFTILPYNLNHGVGKSNKQLKDATTGYSYFAANSENLMKSFFGTTM